VSSEGRLWAALNKLLATDREHHRGRASDSGVAGEVSNELDIDGSAENLDPRRKSRSAARAR